MTPPALRALVCAVCLGAAWSTPLQAQPAPEEDTQRQLLELLRAGNDAFDKGNYDAALALYDEALRLLERPEIHARRARCLERLGRKEEAVEAYRAYLRLDPQAKDQGRIEKEISRLQAEIVEQQRVPVEVLSSPASAEVRLGGPGGKLMGLTPLTLYVEPGEVTLHLSLEGHSSESRSIRAEPNQRQTLEISLKSSAPAPGVVLPAPDTNWSLPGWITLGAGVTLAGTSAFLAWKTEDTIAEANGYSRQDPSHSRGALNDLQAPVAGLEAGFYATGGLALGCLLLGGLMLFLDEAPDSAAEAPRSHLWLNPTHLVWEVSFP